jgi:hypothetical protein
MAAIVYFMKTREDDDFVTYRYGFKDDLQHSLLISKVDRLPTDEKMTFAARLAFKSILRGYRKLGTWPEQGDGCI